MDPNARNKLIGVIDSGTNTTRFVVSNIYIRIIKIIRMIIVSFRIKFFTNFVFTSRYSKLPNWRRSAHTLWR